MQIQQEWDVSPLRAYLLRDYWTPNGGLCLLAGFDYTARIEGAPFQPQWMHTLSPATFQGHYGQDADEVEDLLTKMNNDLDELRSIWAGCKRDSEAEDHSPTFFIEWASSKGFRPDWLGWAIDTGLYVPKQEPEKRLSPGLDKVSLPNAPQIDWDSPASAMMERPKGQPRHAATGQRFTTKRAAMIKHHKGEWPTIEQDMKDAHRNGLNKAKAGVRDWWADVAMEWAGAKGKLKSVDKPTDALTGAIGAMASLPISRTNTLKG